jgi:hypothetical protein
VKNYATLNAEQKAAYNEGLLDAIDHLQAKAEAEDNPLIGAGLRIAAADLVLLRDAQINAEPQ